MPLFAVKITGGQEGDVADIIARRARVRGWPIKSVMVLRGMKGYILIESPHAYLVDQAVAGIKHVKSRIAGVTSLADIEHMIVTRPVIEEVKAGDIIEVIAGPLRGSNARVVRVDTAKNEVVIELLEAAFTVSVTVPAEYIRPLGKR